MGRTESGARRQRRRVPRNPSVQLRPQNQPEVPESSNRLIQAGELVCLDTDTIGCHGYFTDLSRTFLAGDNPATREQIDLYQLAHEQLQHNIELLEVGKDFREYAAKCWTIPDQYLERRYLGPVHGNGMVAEYPILMYPDLFDEAGQDGTFETNMTICVESLPRQHRRRRRRQTRGPDPAHRGPVPNDSPPTHLEPRLLNP